MKGTFASAIDQNDRKAHIMVEDAVTRERVADVLTDINGSYVLAFPRSGKFRYLVECGPSGRTHTGVVDVPRSNSPRAFRQELELTRKGDQEELVIRNYFDAPLEEDTAHFEGLPAESWMVKASAMGRREQRAWRVIGPTWTARELEIRLEMRRELAVRLLDDAGRELTRDDFESLFGHRDAVTVAATLACGPVGSSLEPGNRRGGESDVRGPIAGTVSWRLTVEGTWARCVQALYGDTTLGCAPLEADARVFDVEHEARVEDLHRESHGGRTDLEDPVDVARTLDNYEKCCFKNQRFY